MSIDWKADHQYDPSDSALALAREALPCRRRGPWCEDVNDGRVCSDCQRRAAVATIIDQACEKRERETMERCAAICDEWDDWRKIHAEATGIASSDAAWAAGFLAARIRAAAAALVR